MWRSHFYKFFFYSTLATSFLWGKEAFPWEERKHLTFLGSPFVDAVLEVNREFIHTCSFEIGEVYPVDVLKIKEIFSLYKVKFPEANVVIKRKEPLNLSPEQLSSLGISCRRNLESPVPQVSEEGPALQHVEQLRLILRCPPYLDTLVYASQITQTFSQKNVYADLLSLKGHVLIDGQLLFYGDCLEKALREASHKHNLVLLDLCDLQVSAMFLSRLWGLLELVDVIFLSEFSEQAFLKIPDIAKASRFLARMVPTVFIYSQDTLRILYKEKEVSYPCSKELLPKLITGFLFGYINQGSLEYCLNCAQSLLEERS